MIDKTVPVFGEVKHGDCIVGMATLADASVDHVITDPPYSEHTHGARGSKKFSIPTDLKGAGRSVATERTFGFDALSDEVCALACSHFARIARRWVLVFTDVENVSRWIENLTTAGLEYVRTGVWLKPGAVPQFSGDRPANGFECIVIAHQPGKKRWNGGGKHGVWKCAPVQDGDYENHPTQKPQELIEALIRDFTDKDELICDPFAGSGTTISAAKRLGRRAIGFEMQEQYVHLARQRIADTQEQLSLLDESA